MNVFSLRDQLINDYSTYISSFIQIRDEKIRGYVNHQLTSGFLWPDALIQLNPAFQPGDRVDELVDEGILHQTCKDIFIRDKDKDQSGGYIHLHKHQEDAIRIANKGNNYILTTGTGSGKSLAYIIPIVDHVLRQGSGRGTQAIIVYPMNALANSQMGELKKFLNLGFPNQQGPVTFERYTGQESDEEKQRIMSHPPDILLTNYVMLELILTRPQERQTLVNAAQDLRFLVLDELHTYRGRQGADVAMLVRRVRDSLNATHLQCIGTSATLAGPGSLEDQQKEIANVASILFGDKVLPGHVIGETLRRSTDEYDLSDPVFISSLKQRVKSGNLPSSYEELQHDPLANWIESTLGLTSDATGRLVRARSRSLLGPRGVARELGDLTGLPEDTCAQVVIAILNKGYAIPNPNTGLPTFAFRLHQFISRGDTVFTSLERESDRFCTVYGQQFVPNDRERILLPLAFCRECGQEYYVVKKQVDPEAGREIFLPREYSEHTPEDDTTSGYLYLNTSDPWPADYDGMLEKLPEDWLEEHNGQMRVRPGQRDYLPEDYLVDPLGQVSDRGLTVQFVHTPFKFCLHCGVTYGSRQSSDYSKLTELSSGGRSTDTTILSLSLIRNLRQDKDLKEEARKLLSFTDNRQDASLQAGHFNDFIDIAILRSALYRAVKDAGPIGIAHEDLSTRVFQALGLAFDLYAIDATVKFAQKTETERALRQVLGYRLYRDLERGWRITSPNLEQCGLLEIHYISLDEVCSDEELWQNTHPALISASPETRFNVCRVLLDFMRRELAIKVSYLNPADQESLVQLSRQKLLPPWALDENEKLSYASILFPGSRRGSETYGNIFLSARGGYSQFLRRPTTFKEHHEKIDTEQTKKIIPQILKSLKTGGLVEIVHEPPGGDESEYGYQVPASAMLWKVGDGKKAFHDPIRVPRQPTEGGRTNPFFVDFYRSVGKDLHALEAHEHTAQVPTDKRQEREDKFRAGKLPILFCSPTMELGVDIAELNAVNMRNVPPTPANYAQRSGRAGRQGQPALVFTYCTMGSPHDQYYFKRSDQMVSGTVTPPRLDLTNEDLVRAHVHSIWLAETGLSLKTSLRDLLDLSGDEPTLQVVDSVKAALDSLNSRHRAEIRARKVLDTITGELAHADWYSDTWLAGTLNQVPLQFDLACRRWRTLYSAAKGQQKSQQKIIDDVSRSSWDRDQARRLRQEAESQIDLLTDSENIAQSDFYSYRYFASEGFLPGYSFPRLPLSAYIPGRRIRGAKDEFLSRPRFLAISEFGPRSIIYHEGSRYIINKVNLPVSAEGDLVVLSRAKQCPVCGYFHPITIGDGPDLCERCGAQLDAPLFSLFRLQNVSTYRRNRISSDEEERLRQGYELHTAIRYHETQSGEPSARIARLMSGEMHIATLTYASSATLWRINFGRRRRANRELKGFVLDMERGYWAKEKEDQEDPDDPLSPRLQRVIPFVEDTKNCLLFEHSEPLEQSQMASLQAALKSAIQVQYQLEDNELAAEPLPDPDNRRLLLFYESAEGGAGVLRRLLDQPQAFAEVAGMALQLCHFDPVTGEDLQHAPNAHEPCTAACYDCLMSYYNQIDHRLLDRHSIKDFLIDLTAATALVSPQPISRLEHLERLRNLCQSDLERFFLDYLEEHHYNLPSHAQKLIESCHTRPDFLYEKDCVAIYVDGSHHLFEERQKRDTAQTECMEDLGYTVVRFGILNDWEKVISKYPHVFGGDQ